MKDLPMFPAVPAVRESTIGNSKLGDRILTESRPTGHTCPDTCSMKRENILGPDGRWHRSPCYSAAIGIYHQTVPAGIMHRYIAWSMDRAGWWARRRREWTKAAAAGRPVRFLVHGDICRMGDPRSLDREWLADVIRTARGIPGFRGWGYTHAWRLLGARHRAMLARVGITFYASVHSHEGARMARAAGFRIAKVDRAPKRGYQGPRALPVDGKMAVICPQQVGTKVDCASCGICPEGLADIVLLSH